ncbi:MAG: hypothetical protein HFE75_15070 [Firmicutes bacterium]|jgi:hypothetical protein|nr:hypothetical protein [Bacillota bacterium]
MIQLHAKMTKALRQLNTLYANFQKELDKLPIGSLYVLKRKGSSYYYHSMWNSGKKTNIYLNPRVPADADLIQKLWHQRFIRSSLRTLENNIKALSYALKRFRPYDPEEISTSLPPAYQSVWKSHDLLLPQPLRLDAWESEPYLRNTSYPEELVHETVCGIFVRSKAESMILDMLNQLHIPFRYEPLITANGKKYAPDFSTLRLKDREIMYWEHFGQMDNPEYVAKNALKLMDYQKSGINVNQNLIITMETKDQPLTAKEILNTINARLL